MLYFRKKGLHGLRQGTNNTWLHANKQLVNDFYSGCVERTKTLCHEPYTGNIVTFALLVLLVSHHGVGHGIRCTQKDGC